MNAVTYADMGYPVYTSTLRHYFSEQVARIAQLLAQERDLKEKMLATGRELADTLLVIADNPIPLSEKAISLTRDNLEWMEATLDGKNQGFMLDGAQHGRLKAIYQDIAESLSFIIIQSAFSAR